MKLSEQMFRCGIFTSLRQVYKWAAEVVKLENKSDDEQGLRYKTQNETSKRIYQLEAELAMYERDETFGTLAIQLVRLEEDLKQCVDDGINCAVELHASEAENEAQREFVATILCWKPEWTQTTYFKNLSEELRNDLIELAKLTKYEGSGGMDDEWLDALLTREESE